MTKNNEYLPFSSEILDVIKHTDFEYTFRMRFDGESKPGQFFEVSLPKYGEAPISISSIDEGVIDLTIRKVGKVTDEVFEHYIGDHLFMRGPYGNGFDVDNYKGKELVVIAGGTGLSPVRGVIEYFWRHPDEVQRLTLICGCRTPQDILFYEDQKRWNETHDVTLTVDINTCGFDCEEGMVTKHIPLLEMRDVSKAMAIVVGPPLMMKFSIIELEKLGFVEENIWVSYERKMCCGIGKCGHCRILDTYICVDGPVFNYVEGKHLID